MRLGEKFDWNDLQLLLVISDTGYVLETASRLGIDPTTITRRLKRLEKRLGVKLVERIKGGVVLSENCKKLVKIARSLDRDLESAFSDSEDEGDLRGTVRIAVTDFLLDPIIDDLAKLQSRHKGLQIDITESYSRQSLDDRETDIAVRITDHPNDGLVGIRQEALQFSVYGKHKDKQQSSGRSWISWNLPQSPHDQWISLYDDQGTIAMRTGSVISQAKLANLGVGVAVLPEAYVRSKADLSLVKLDEVWEQSLWVLTHAELRNVPRIQKTMRVISEALRRALK